MDENRTTAAVQRYLNDLADAGGDSAAEPIVRDLLGRSADRLHQLCAGLLFRAYPRLARGPLNLRPDELLSAVVERLLKAMRSVRPTTVRQFFALANQHIRWELNDLARRLDEQAAAVELRDSHVCAAPAPQSSDAGPSASSSRPGPGLARILAEIDRLPPDEREVFNLVRVQGLTQPEAAHVVGVSVKTVQRRLNRCLALLSRRLGDLGPAPPPPPPPPPPSFGTAADR
jgi:RNA polymerase sigma-70 factor (ECF subfamily)